MKVGLFPGGVEGLVNLLSKDDYAEGQMWAAWTLGQIAYKVVENRMKVGWFPGTLEGLVDLLSKDDNAEGQENAALTLGQISHKVVKNQIKVGSFPGVVEGLVNLLSKDDNAEWQKMAAWTLGQIEDEVVENQLKVGLFPGAAKGLVNLLSKDDNAEGEKWAAWTLGQNFAAGTLEKKVKVWSYPGAVDALLELLTMHNNNEGYAIALLCSNELLTFVELASFLMSFHDTKIVCSRVVKGVTPAAQLQPFETVCLHHYFATISCHHYRPNGFECMEDCQSPWSKVQRLVKTKQKYKGSKRAVKKGLQLRVSAQCSWPKQNSARYCRRILMKLYNHSMLSKALLSEV